MSYLFFFLFLFRILQPIFIGKLLLYFNPINSANTTNSGYAYLCACGLLLSMFISIIITRSAHTEVLHCGMKIRIACCSLIFRKVYNGYIYSIVFVTGHFTIMFTFCFFISYYIIWSHFRNKKGKITFFFYWKFLLSPIVVNIFSWNFF